MSEHRFQRELFSYEEDGVVWSVWITKNFLVLRKDGVGVGHVSLMQLKEKLGGRHPFKQSDITHSGNPPIGRVNTGRTSFSEPRMQNIPIRQSTAGEKAMRLADAVWNAAEGDKLEEFMKSLDYTELEQHMLNHIVHDSVELDVPKDLSEEELRQWWKDQVDKLDLKELLYGVFKDKEDLDVFVPIRHTLREEFVHVPTLAKADEFVTRAYAGDPLEASEDDDQETAAMKAFALSFVDEVQKNDGVGQSFSAQQTVMGARRDKFYNQVLGKPFIPEDGPAIKKPEGELEVPKNMDDAKRYTLIGVDHALGPDKSELQLIDLSTGESHDPHAALAAGLITEDELNKAMKPEQYNAVYATSLRQHAKSVGFAFKERPWLRDIYEGKHRDISMGCVVPAPPKCSVEGCNWPNDELTHQPGCEHYEGGEE